ncbi:MAG TPA: rhomboid family intramembrane serine protease [Thermoanaerobaculia bacterium]|nr:rhomboid family intramembrane serine protease [Thermoanaerobaculia bacterium]
MIGRRRGTPATAALIVAILIAFGIEIVTGAWTNGAILAELGAILRYDILVEHEYWRLVSAMFLHGDGTIKGTLLHLMMNLWALFQLGTLYEIMFGTRRFLWVYFGTGIVASITSMVVTGGPSVGASGAIFGLLGAFIFSVRRSPRWRHDRVARSVVKQCLFWAVANILVTSQIPQIDNAAHIGGLVAGLVLGFVLPQPAPPPQPPAEVVIDVRPYRGPEEDD